MESPYSAPPHNDASRPSIAFPLGTAFLLIIVFCLSGIFSCIYHWEKLRSLRRSFSNDSADPEAASAKPTPTHLDFKQNTNQSLSVLMPGDQIPKFIALPCPCKPPIPQGNIVVEVQKPP